MDDQADMVQSGDNAALLGPGAPARASGHEWPTAPASTGSCFVVEREPSSPEPGSEALFRCGHCLASVPDVGDDPACRCPSCQRRNALPTSFWIGCDRCGFEQRLRPRQLGAEPRCTSCGQVLVVEDVVLTPLNRHRRHVVRVRQHRHHHHGRRRAGGRHDQAILLLLMFAGGVLLSLKLLSRL